MKRNISPKPNTSQGFLVFREAMEENFEEKEAKYFQSDNFRSNFLGLDRGSIVSDFASLTPWNRGLYFEEKS